MNKFLFKYIFCCIFRKLFLKTLFLISDIFFKRFAAFYLKNFTVKPPVIFGQTLYEHIRLINEKQDD